MSCRFDICPIYSEVVDMYESILFSIILNLFYFVIFSLLFATF